MLRSYHRPEQGVFIIDGKTFCFNAVPDVVGTSRHTLSRVMKGEAGRSAVHGNSDRLRTRGRHAVANAYAKAFWGSYVSMWAIPVNSIGAEFRQNSALDAPPAYTSTILVPEERVRVLHSAA